jgi:hypothetical protein
MAKGQQRSTKEKKKPKQKKVVAPAPSSVASAAQSGKPGQTGGAKKGR